MIVPILLLGLASFVIAWLFTFAMKRIAPKLGFVDKPGGRKIHANPKPLLGGVAIFCGFVLPMLAGLVYVQLAPPPNLATKEIGMLSMSDWRTLQTRSAPDPEISRAYWDGIRRQTPLALGFLGAMLVMHIMGIFDDRKALGPYLKLFVQLLTISLLVVCFDLRALTALGYLPSVILTILWITAITNAFNFLDNMDGLSAGIGAVCTVAFLIAALSIGQWFVAASLALLLGSLIGFLCFNFPPATIFMGDCGSLLIGLVLGVLTIRTTFLQPDQSFGAGWYAVFAPIIVLAVPLYDLIVVSIIRMSRGKSPFVGDTNHFSHRLVQRGMSRRTAVLCLYLITAATSASAILLPHVTSTWAAMLIFGQTLLILGVVMLLEQHPISSGTGEVPNQPRSREEGAK